MADLPELLDRAADAYNAPGRRMPASQSGTPTASGIRSSPPGSRGTPATTGTTECGPGSRTSTRCSRRCTWSSAEFRQVGDRLLVLGQMTATGRVSGVEVSSEVAWVMELRDDKLQRGWAYTSHEEAERAAEEAPR